MAMNKHYTHMSLIVQHAETLQNDAEALYWNIIKLEDMVKEHAGNLVGRCGDPAIDREPLMSETVTAVPRSLLDQLKNFRQKLTIVREAARHRMEVDEIHYKIVLEDYAKLMNAAAQPKT